MQIEVKNKHTEGCMICGEELSYSENVKTYHCSLCKKEFTSTISCKHGHYICDECHRADSNQIIKIILETSLSTNPIELAREIMAAPVFQMHGPEHHLMVPMVLLTALKNMGMNITDSQIKNAWLRAKQLPGGSCGSWGACGAAIGTGIALSVIRGLTPLSQEIWGQTNRDTGEVLQSVGAYGGPRCCKRSTYSSILAAIKILERDSNVHFSEEAHKLPVCKDFWRNKQCLKTECPYYPR
ncbi:DUF5714 domain-containing protein [Desulfitobacterium metallireducens]|uniref:SAM-dependent methyltransferase n=1 Tax=Desulfitobacterium metallireducens DSM 15288 TaxID=871968 RepID=W0EE27_9FIRM|nr:DUF5714 domain-containing protein [Desulfitobacterium metallireducens]AHF07758.1 SAM-dependent methyltransferase [Desulfitobacterium metallireducens DSM 15288]